MSLIVLLVGVAFADRVLWTEPPDAASVAAVGRTLPGASSAPLETLVTGGAAAFDPAAIEVLRTELEEVRPLSEVFDGELQIMARLSKAAEDVRVLRSPEERDLLRRALLFKGFAVHRYFQDKLGTEAAAAPYRTGADADAAVTAWLDACALLAAPPSVRAEDIPEPQQRLAFDETQARCMALPAATFIVGDLAQGAEVRVDGVRIEGGPGVRVRLVPGRHLFHVAVGDTVLLAQDARIKPGSDAIVSAPFGPVELATLGELVRSGSDGWTVPAAARVPIGGFGEPVYAAIPAGERTTLLRIDGETALRVKIRPPESRSAMRVVGRGTLGGGWLSTGDFYLQNRGDGAPHAAATVNAGTPAASLGASLDATWWSIGVGIDGQLTVGEYHSLPTGSTTTSVFLHPHLAAGLPWVQATVGPLFPWYLGVGARARIPIARPVEIFAAGVYGAPLDRPREAGAPTFEPLPLYTAWAGVSFRLER